MDMYIVNVYRWACYQFTDHNLKVITGLSWDDFIMAL